MKLVSPDSLQGAEKLVFENLKPWFPTGSVCVNVMLGQDPWDLRPLLLVNNRVTLYRFSRPLASSALNQLAAEMQGFVVIGGWDMKIHRRDGQERLLMTRPFVVSTLAESLAKMERGAQRQALVSDLIGVVKDLGRRNLVHGHISPANIAHVEGKIILLDPRFGSLHNSTDGYLAPESVPGEEPKPSVDLYGLGCVIHEIVGPDATHQQREIIDRLRLPSPRQRPTIEEVSREFVRSVPAQSHETIRGGRVLNKRDASAKQFTGSEGSRAEVAPGTLAENNRALSFAGICCAVIFGGGYILKSSAPYIYNDLFARVPFLVRSHNPEFDLAWASGDKARMRSIARAAVIERDPAAQNAILDDILSGENRPGVNAQLVRVALNPSWASDLSKTDKLAALALGVQQLVPEGIQGLPPLSELHSGVILAIAGQTQPTKGNQELKSISLDRMALLPAPFGKIFEQLKGSGTKSLGQPEALALAGMVSGNPPASTVEAYITPDTPTAVALSRLAVIDPLLGAQEPLASQMLATLRDRGGEIGQVLSWFDIDALGLWSKAKSSDKLRLLLGEVPSSGLTLSHYADLLTFPLPAVRGKSAEIISTRLVKTESKELLVVLAGGQNRLSRDQTVALLSALALEPSKRSPFVVAWFELKPSVDMVLLVLLARSNVDSSDLFNLEAARYLRKAQWTATPEMLQIMARHPEPLARSLAYGRLTTRDPAQKAILQKRLSEETDPGLLKVLTAKLSPPPLVIPSPTPEVVVTP